MIRPFFAVVFCIVISGQVLAAPAPVNAPRHLAGKGWRGIENLNAKATSDSKSNEILFAFDGLEVTDEDAPNFPSKKVTISVVLADGRLVEKKQP